MDLPTEQHHLQDLGSTSGVGHAVSEPTNGQRTDSDGAAPVHADPSPQTVVGQLGLEGPADNPTQDDHFTGGSR